MSLAPSIHSPSQINRGLKTTLPTHGQYQSRRQGEKETGRWKEKRTTVTGRNLCAQSPIHLKPPMHVCLCGTPEKRGNDDNKIAEPRRSITTSSYAAAEHPAPLCSLYSLWPGRMKSWILTNAPGWFSSQTSSRRTVVCWMSCSRAAVEDLPRETVPR